MDQNKISFIVNSVVNNKFKTEMLRTGKSIIFKREADSEEEFVEPTKEFKGVFTDLVVNEFTKTSSQTKQFIDLIYTSFNNAINLYLKQKGMDQDDVIFLYKGGNILRIVAYETMHELPGIVSDRLSAYYKDSFKKSDADFTISINPYLKNFEAVFKDMNDLAFLLQNEIRNIFLASPEKYFEFYNLDSDARTRILKKHLDKLNESGTIKEKKFGFDGKFDTIVFKNNKVSENNQRDPEDLVYIPKRDFQIDYVPNTKDTELLSLKKLNSIRNSDPIYNNLKPLVDEQKKILGDKTDVEMYISYNNTLTFEKFKRLTAFNLVRTKVSFNAYFDYVNRPENLDVGKPGTSVPGNPDLLRLDGELIDVSIGKREDASLAHFYDNRKKYISTYKIGSDPDNMLYFKAYSIVYLLEDLERILFIDSEFPWDDVKYVKRIKRILFMYMLLLFLNKIPNSMRQTYVNTVNQIMDQVSQYANSKNQADKQKALGYIKTYLETSNNNPKLFPFRELMTNLVKILNNPNTDVEKLKELVAVVKENITIMNVAFKSLDKFINTASLFEGTILAADKFVQDGGSVGYWQ